MILSLSHQFIYVHISKTAGSVIADLLEEHDIDPTQYRWVRLLGRLGINLNYLGPVKGRRFRRHATALTAQRHLPREVFEGSFKFAFVRNPWDWWVSLYRWIGNTPPHHRHKRVSAMSFEQYIQWEHRKRKRSQHAFVCDRQGELLVDFLGRFETIHADFDRVCSHLGLEVTLPPRTAARVDYREFYTPPLEEMVSEMSARDIEMFGYTYEGLDESVLDQLNSKCGGPLFSGEEPGLSHKASPAAR